MIIESLRSSQSSFDMGDEIEENVLSGNEGHSPVCKVAVGSYVRAKSKAEGLTGTQQANISSQANCSSSDSDSDDSVDRGIEQAIMEYLKEKDDHKRKAEPCSTFHPSHKVPRKNLLVPEVSEQNSDSNMFPITSNQFPKSVKAETTTAPAVVPIKKHIKNKASINDKIVAMASNQSTTKGLILPKEQTKSPCKAVGLFSKVECPISVNVEEESTDSSSDDGIEEAIQRYQLEKNEQQNRDDFDLHAFIDDSDSTSDDGIEEAIRCYQLEQLKKKNALKPLLHKQKTLHKSLINTAGSTSMENTKKHKAKKKKIKREKELKSVPYNNPSSGCISRNSLPESSKSKGNGLLLFKADSFKEQPAPPPLPPKVNTTAELMCAEAILDISKTVMPGAIHHSTGLSSCAPAESSLQSSRPDNCPDEESDGSSIDSEDGIEQEIRKFLEQKAQMHKPLPNSAVVQEPCGVNEAEETKPKAVTPQKKHSKLSLTRRRKERLENSLNSTMSETDNSVQETPSKALPEHGKESSAAAFSHSQTNPSVGKRGTEPSGDKSSSLDSDEDLDSAIKDLLKTKKKSKKKVRDLKRKSRKCLKDDKLMTKKFKPDLVKKKKVLKSKDTSQDQTHLSASVSQQKQTAKSDEQNMHGGELKSAVAQDAPALPNTQPALQTNDDSSSVDSDDGIEQEIQKFLAEKARVSTTEQNKDEDVVRNGTAVPRSPPQEVEDKLENQLAEIPGKSPSPLSGQSPMGSHSLPTPQSLRSDIPPLTHSHLTSGPSHSSGLLEPADGAGVARTKQQQELQRQPSQPDATPQPERVRSALTPSIAHSRSESIKWRQSFGLLPTPKRSPISWTPFYVTSSKAAEAASANSPFQSGVTNPVSQAPASVWSSSRTGKAPFHCSAETTGGSAHRTPTSNLFSAAMQHSRMPFTRNLVHDHRSQCLIEGDAKSTVHMPKDKTTFVQLEANRTNHVQIRSREASEGKERAHSLSERRREGESAKIDDEEEHQDRTEGEFIDESDCESGTRRNPEKKQGFSTL